MAHTFNSIVIHRPMAEVFEATNDIESWPQVFDEYSDAKVLERNGNTITFRLTNKEGKSWVSSRVVDPTFWIATAIRGEPKHPFRYMHLRWIYRPVDGGTELTWEQFFEMDPASGTTDEAAVQRITEHSRKNQANFKRWLEARAGAKESGT